MPETTYGFDILTVRNFGLCAHVTETCEDVDYYET
jgi:hypothetical protein